jgi:argininosuccinate lyase
MDVWNFWMLERDYSRFVDSMKRIDISPLGAAALSGTTHPIDNSLFLASRNMS